MPETPLTKGDPVSTAPVPVKPLTESSAVLVTKMSPAASIETADGAERPLPVKLVPMPADVNRTIDEEPELATQALPFLSRAMPSDLLMPPLV